MEYRIIIDLVHKNKDLKGQNLTLDSLFLEFNNYGNAYMNKFGENFGVIRGNIQNEEDINFLKLKYGFIFEAT